MGAISNAFPDRKGNVDFDAVKAAARLNARNLVPSWLPGGRREGNEWVVRNPMRIDATPGSFKVNMLDGFFKDFASGEGGDLIGLFGRLNNLSPLDAARELGEILGVPLQSNVARLHAVARGVIPPVVTSPPRVREIMAPAESLRDPDTFPPRTRPDSQGKPTFSAAGDEGPPRFSDEKRRHEYKCGSTTIKIKIMRKGASRALQWFRVEGGWQLQKPVGYRAVPFIGGADPLDPERSHEPVFWPEGEKDADTITSKGALALTFGVTGDGLTADCEEYFRGRDVVILADNDAGGGEHAEAKAALVHPVAKS
jgi:putative DNA primase/helicase